MKKGKNEFIIFITFTTLFILILDPKSAIDGASKGIELCLKTLVPALFPFMIISECCGMLLFGLRSSVLRKLMKPCKLPNGSEIIYMLGLLSGYPIGAKIISDAYNENLIKKNDANHMLRFCNNAGPSFIFGILGSMFSQPLMPWIIWEIHIFSAYLVGVFTAKAESTNDLSIPAKSFHFSKTVPAAVKTMGNVCGWVVLFRVILSFFKKWFFFFFPMPFQVLLSGLLELSNGCIQLAEIKNVYEKFIISVFLISFGGFCVTMQTASLIPAGTVKYYLSGKLYQCLIALILSIPVIILMENLSICFLILPIFCLFIFKIWCVVKSAKKQ